MFIIWNIPEQKYFADIKPVSVTDDSPDLSNTVTEKLIQYLNHSRHKRVLPLRRRIFLYNIIYQWISLSQSVAICM